MINYSFQLWGWLYLKSVSSDSFVTKSFSGISTTYLSKSTNDTKNQTGESSDKLSQTVSSGTLCHTKVLVVFYHTTNISHRCQDLMGESSDKLSQTVSSGTLYHIKVLVVFYHTTNESHRCQDLTGESSDKLKN